MPIESISRQRTHSVVDSQVVNSMSKEDFLVQNGAVQQKERSSEVDYKKWVLLSLCGRASAESYQGYTYDNRLCGRHDNANQRNFLSVWIELNCVFGHHDHNQRYSLANVNPLRNSRKHVFLFEEIREKMEKHLKNRLLRFSPIASPKTMRLQSK